MSFSPEWLALREPVDHRSISQPLRAKVAARLAGAAPVNVMDLGCGSGSNLRALADSLRQFQGVKTKDLLAARHEKLLSYGKFKEISPSE